MVAWPESSTNFFCIVVWEVSQLVVVKRVQDTRHNHGDETSAPLQATTASLVLLYACSLPPPVQASRARSSLAPPAQPVATWPHQLRPLVLFGSTWPARGLPPG